MKPEIAFILGALEDGSLIKNERKGILELSLNGKTEKG